MITPMQGRSIELRRLEARLSSLPSAEACSRISKRSDLKPREHHLGLGVAEAGVELDDARTALGHHQPGVDHAAVLDALLASAPSKRSAGARRCSTRSRACAPSTIGAGL